MCVEMFGIVTCTFECAGFLDCEVCDVVMVVWIVDVGVELVVFVGYMQFVMSVFLCVFL